MQILINGNPLKLGIDTSGPSRLVNEDSLKIGGHWFHLLAIQVDKELSNIAVDVSSQPEVDHAVEICDAALQTQEIEGRHYVIIIVPHGQ
jgi:hypothetical protein